MTGLNDLSMSMKRSEAVRMMALKAFMRSRGFLTPDSSLGARLKQRQQVSSMVSGFIANTGKLIPMNEPVERNLEMRNLMILGCKLFFSSLMNNSPPSYSSKRQSNRLQQSSYSTTAKDAYFIPSLSPTLPSLSHTLPSYQPCSQCPTRSISYFSRRARIAAAFTQSTDLGFCIFCSGTSLQLRKNAHSLNASTTFCGLPPRIQYCLSPAITNSCYWTYSQREMEERGRDLLAPSRVRTRAILSVSRDRVAAYHTPRYFDFIQQFIIIDKTLIGMLQAQLDVHELSFNP